MPGSGYHGVINHSMELSFSFITISVSITKLFVLMLAGYILYAASFIDDKFTDLLSHLLVRVVFPALIIYKTITHFTFQGYSYWWILPLMGVLFSVSGMLIGAVIYRFMRMDSSYKEFMCCSGFQNCGYLPMNLILFSFTGAVRDRLLIYLFLFIVGFNLLMWSLVPLFLSGRLKRGMNAKVLLNPPVLATCFSLLWVAFFGRDSIPEVLMDPVKQIGNMAFPLAMITLGAYLRKYRAHIPEKNIPVIASLLTKMFIFPVIVLYVLSLIHIGMDYKFFLFLQSIMPVAVSLIVISGPAGADSKFISSNIFYSHLIAFLSTPVWLAVFRYVMKG